MKLTDYDLSRDKSAMLAAFLSDHKPAADQVPVMVKPAPAKPTKLVPKPASKRDRSTRADVLSRAQLIYDMQLKGMGKSAIMQATGMTENQYKSALQAAHRNGIIPPGFTAGHRQKIAVTEKVKRDLRRMSRASFCEKYGLSMRTVTRMRSRLGITNVVFSHRWYAEDVAGLFEHRAAGLSYEAIGAIYGVTRSSICEVVRKAQKRGIECYPLRPRNK